MKKIKNQLSAFVIMCFDEKLTIVYEKVIKPVLESHQIDCIRSDKDSKIGLITAQIEETIKNVQLIICDLTYNNPNVFYELGIASALKKDIILISQSPADAPFDVQNYKIIGYQDTKIGLLDLRDDLSKYIIRLFPNQDNIIAPDKNIKILLSPNEKEEQRLALLSSSLPLKRQAIRYLGDTKDKDSYDTIKSLIGFEKDTDLLRDVFTSLQKIDPEKAKNVLIEEGLRIQPEYLVRERVVLLLGNYSPDKDLVQQLLNQLRDTSWGVRKSSCDVLGTWKKNEEPILTGLRRMLNDSEQMVRYAARNALEQIMDDKTSKE